MTDKVTHLMTDFVHGLQRQIDALPADRRADAARMIDQDMRAAIGAIDRIVSALTEFAGRIDR